MRIEWSEPAMQDMAALRDYIANDSPSRAERFIQRLFEHVDNLEAFPELGRKAPETDTPNIRELVFQGYRIIYRISPYRVDILTVLHGSRDLSNPGNRPWEA
ncbi:MAG: type II toxin-antitoxin system RelE/ParE family toxin [Sulfuricella sp.]|nr:type II toxin-antitoxin system RelE/ParE family toxin [Gammaproteobacteria bacterium]